MKTHTMFIELFELLQIECKSQQKNLSYVVLKRSLENEEFKKRLKISCGKVVKDMDV